MAYDAKNVLDNTYSLAERKKIPIKELETKCGMQVGTLSRIKAGRVKLSIEKLICLADALDVSVDSLMFSNADGMSEDTLYQSRVIKELIRKTDAGDFVWHRLVINDDIRSLPSHIQDDVFWYNSSIEDMPVGVLFKTADGSSVEPSSQLCFYTNLAEDTELYYLTSIAAAREKPIVELHLFGNLSYGQYYNNDPITHSRIATTVFFPTIFGIAESLRDSIRASMRRINIAPWAKEAVDHLIFGIEPPQTAVNYVQPNVQADDEEVPF